ncbi:MAG: sulfatase-like hydrolase/transferase [Acidobacteriaceae bacterium]
MSDLRPNFLLIFTDQHRGDCLGVEGHPVLQTPYLDEIAGMGVRFSNAYSTCPVCVPARRTLMSGRSEAKHGVLTNYDTWMDGPTLPGELSRAGYQSHLVGKLHLWPQRKLYGFDSADWADGPHRSPWVSDYDRFLEREGVRIPDGGTAHGCSQNGWVARPWHLDERLHFTNWCADRAIEFLERRDPTVPFFLNVSFHQPHQPCTPPQVYWERYINRDLPEPVVGDWARVFAGPQRGLPVTSWRTALDPEVMRQFRAGYFGCINHIDDQIGRLLYSLPRNTVILFVSDHGEMLGDHQWIRKCNGLQGSVRVPFLVRMNGGSKIAPGRVLDAPVGLMDVMPTILDLAAIDVPPACDGRSLAPLLRGEIATVRSHVHGECALVPSLNSGMQFVTDGRTKYIWHPGTGNELLFNLVDDPMELRNLANESTAVEIRARWRRVLVQELAGRPEGFVRDGELQILGGPTPFCLPGFERKPMTFDHPIARGAGLVIG